MRLCLTLLLLLPIPAFATGLPACARSGSVSVMINGLPALRLSDVSLCPMDSYSVIPGIVVEGEPMVQFSPAGSGCSHGASQDVIVEGKAVPRAGDIACPPQ